jgi:hypothetical protein
MVRLSSGPHQYSANKSIVHRISADYVNRYTAGATQRAKSHAKQNRCGYTARLLPGPLAAPVQMTGTTVLSARPDGFLAAAVPGGHERLPQTWKRHQAGKSKH